MAPTTVSSTPVRARGRTSVSTNAPASSRPASGRRLGDGSVPPKSPLPAVTPTASLHLPPPPEQILPAPSNPAPSVTVLQPPVAAFSVPAPLELLPPPLPPHAIFNAQPMEIVVDGEFEDVEAQDIAPPVMDASDMAVPLLPSDYFALLCGQDLPNTHAVALTSAP